LNPAAGEAIEFTLPEEEDGVLPESLHAFARPDDSGARIPTGMDASNMTFSEVDYLPLFRKLGLNGVLTLFEALLGDCRVVLHSTELATLSSCSQAAVGMLSPFVWPHIFIPVLPKKLLDMCCAPMPFLVGVLEHHIPHVQRLPLEQGVVFVDLDRRKITGVDPAQPAFLPGQEGAALRASLAAALHKAQKEKRFDNQAIANAFFDFFVSIFGSYRRFLSQKGNPADSSEGGEVELNWSEDSFFASHSSAVQAFLLRFQGSQMYAQWREERPSVALKRRNELTLFERKTLEIQEGYLGQDYSEKMMSKLNSAGTSMAFRFGQMMGDSRSPVKTPTPHGQEGALGKSAVWDEVLTVGVTCHAPDPAAIVRSRAPPAESKSAEHQVSQEQLGQAQGQGSASPPRSIDELLPYMDSPPRSIDDTMDEWAAMESNGGYDGGDKEDAWGASTGDSSAAQQQLASSDAGEEEWGAFASNQDFGWPGTAPAAAAAAAAGGHAAGGADSSLEELLGPSQYGNQTRGPPSLYGNFQSETYGGAMQGGGGAWRPVAGGYRPQQQAPLQSHHHQPGLPGILSGAMRLQQQRGVPAGGQVADIWQGLGCEDDAAGHDVMDLLS